MIIARELGWKTAIWRKRSKIPAGEGRKPVPLTPRGRQRPVLPSRRRCLLRCSARVCVVKTGRTGAASRRLQRWKSARAISAAALKNVRLCHQRPRAASGQSNRQHSRDIPFVVLVGGSSLDFEVPQLVTDVGALPPGRRRGNIFAAAKAQETRGGTHVPFLAAQANLHMDSNHSAPAIVITVINDCVQPCAMKCCAGYRRGRHPFPASASPGWRCR